jgi:hypothetical protein
VVFLNWSFNSRHVILVFPFIVPAAPISVRLPIFEHVGQHLQAQCDVSGEEVTSWSIRSGWLSLQRIAVDKFAITRNVERRPLRGKHMHSGPILSE